MTDDFLIDTDRFQQRTSKAGNHYYQFNLYIRDRRTPPLWELLSIGWRFQDGKLLPPFIQLYGRCYNSHYVSPAMAEAIYQHVTEKIATLEDVPVVPKAAEAPSVRPKNFEKIMPAFFEQNFAKKTIKKKAGVPVLQLHTAPGQDAPEISEAEETEKMFEQATVSDYARSNGHTTVEPLEVRMARFPNLFQ